MKDFVNLYVPRMAVDQIIEGLRERMIIWRATYEYLTSGYPQSANCIEQCSCPNEALAIADHYEAIILSITKQLREE